MNNRFDTLPNGIPSALVAGDLWAWQDSALAASYDPVDYTLSYALSPEAGGAPVAITATASGGVFVVSKSDTDAVVTGLQRWVAFITRDADAARVTVGQGTLRIFADAATATGDQRTDNEKALAAIEAVLQGRAGKDQESYSIEGRSLSRTPVADLIRLQAHFTALVTRERGGRGDGITRKLIRMT